MLKPGDPAPDFQVQSHSGEDVSLHALRGKNVLLWFFPKADTPGCTAEGCALRDVHEEFAKRNTVVCGVSFDERDDNAAFAEKHEFPFALLSDTDRDIGLAYGACHDPEDGYAERISFLIDEDGRVAKVWTKVEPRTHAQEVLAWLDGQS